MAIDKPDDPFFTASTRLHGYLLDRHWKGSAVAGQDPGVRLNARVGRFVKSYLRALPWTDDMVYLQAQGYWILSNWMLNDIDDGPYREIALATSVFMAGTQRADGGWDYPNPEWRGRVATVEGCFAALGLLESHERVPDGRLLESALKWHSFLETEIGYRPGGGVNYFANRSVPHGGGVPNNSTLVLWMLARLAAVTGDASYLRRAPQLVRWLGDVQLPNGELPYKVAFDGRVQQHFLCFNYNAFEFLDLVHYFRLTGDSDAWPIIVKLAGFLSTGTTSQGVARFACDRDNPLVLYYTSALATALSQARRLGIGDFHQADKAYKWLIGQQLPNGGFPFYSARNYGFLTDRGSYPRYLTMILHNLLWESLNRAS